MKRRFIGEVLSALLGRPPTIKTIICTEIIGKEPYPIGAALRYGEVISIVRSKLAAREEAPLGA
jgi:hypothetical protein